MVEYHNDYLRHRSKGETSPIGITFSAFDLLHAGHCEMLKEAKSRSDYLIACIHVNPFIENKMKQTPFQSLVERWIVLQSNKYVDEIIPYQTEEEVIQILKLKNPTIRIIGEDYIGKDFTGKDYCNEMGIRIYYNKRKHDISSSSKRNKIKNG